MRRALNGKRCWRKWSIGCWRRRSYGERWGRHWLDVARYADTKGYVFQDERRFAYAYTYRDYVIKAFNDDLPFDQFILEQLAADRLVAKGQAPPKSQAAMGFLTLGRRFLNNIHDIIDDRIDVVTRGMLGLTVACARCHDHKYDPIPTKDYYSLYGVFTSSVEPKELPLLGEPAQTPEYLAFQKKLAELEKAVADYQAKYKKELAEKNRKFRDELTALQKKVDAFKANSPGAPLRGMVLVDRPKPASPRAVARQSEHARPHVPRQFLPVLRRQTEAVQGRQRPARAGPGHRRQGQSAHRPRLRQSRLDASLRQRARDHPEQFRPARRSPSHPELLDYLAVSFMEDGWSIKKLHRRIMLSKTISCPAARMRRPAIDADNRLLARESPPARLRGDARCAAGGFG